MNDQEQRGIAARAGDALKALGRLLAPLLRTLGRAVMAAGRGLWKAGAKGAKAARERLAQRRAGGRAGQASAEEAESAE